VKKPTGEEVECPSCGSTDLRWSSKPHWMNFLMAFLSRDPVRCNECGFRFYARAFSDLEYENEVLKKHKGHRLPPEQEDDDDD